MDESKTGGKDESKTRVMDDIVEKFLEEKLEKEIEKARKAAADGWCTRLKSNCNKFISILDDCKELLDLMRNKKGTGREKLYTLLNVITEWHDLSTKTTNPVTQRSLCKISNDLKQLKEGVEVELAKKEAAPEEPKEPQIYRWSCHAESLAKIHGFDDKLMTMERLLLKPTPKAIGIVGVAGVGKTALCQQAYNLPPVKEHFLLRIWLCLSKNQDHIRFEDQLKMMLSCLGYEDQVIQKIVVEEKLKLALQRHLSRGRYLIVLDDVWIGKENANLVEKEEIRKLFNFLSQPLGTIIVTSRSPELEQMLGANNINMHKLLPLADRDSCLKIFTDAKEGKTKQSEDEEKRFQGDKTKPSEDVEKEDKTKPSEDVEKEDKTKPSEDEEKEDKTKLSEDEKKRKLSPDEEKRVLDKCAGLPLMAKMLGKIAAQETLKPSN